ncbi:iron permease FTR1/Fip1/EfeU [Melampsora americana]|nr:iron permease FTR1/Fip1/EfeU [Melampsora americana]
MVKSLFSVPIFLICFREVLEAAIILSVLLALVEQIVKRSPTSTHTPASSTPLDRNSHLITDAELSDSDRDALDPVHTSSEDTRPEYDKKLVKRMRLQIFSGTFVGLFISVCIGATFLAIYYTQLNDIYGNSEELWEGIFSIVACCMIFIMGITMMRMDRAKVKWRLQLSKAFDQGYLSNSEQEKLVKPRKIDLIKSIFALGTANEDRSTRSSKYLLFFLPAATVLREGLEAVVFIGGVSLGQPASSIPIAAVTGIGLGMIIGYVIYSSSARLNLSIFLIVSTIALMYIGAGLITKATWYFTMHRYIQAVGGDAAEAGDGPGSFPVDGLLWHLDYGNPENKLAAGGWTIFSGVLGWNNTGTLATVLIYIAFWLLVSITLVYMKWKEGRCTIFNISSQARKRRLERLDNRICKDHQTELKSSFVGDNSLVRPELAAQKDMMIQDYIPNLL